MGHSPIPLFLFVPSFDSSVSGDQPHRALNPACSCARPTAPAHAGCAASVVRSIAADPPELVVVGAVNLPPERVTRIARHHLFSVGPVTCSPMDDQIVRTLHMPRVLLVAVGAALAVSDTVPTILGEVDLAAIR